MMKNQLLGGVAGEVSAPKSAKMMLSNQQLTDLYAQCIKLSTENVNLEHFKTEVVAEN